MTTDPTRARRRWAPPPMDDYRPMVVNVALTGAVPGKSDNKFLPLTPEEIAQDALRCADAGAAVVHVHVRDESGAPIHRRDLYERAIGPIRDQRPDLIICVTTSSRVNSDLRTRMIGLDLDPGLRPDLASLTLGSFNFSRSPSVNPPAEIVALLERMNELGIQPEFEVFELGMVNTLWSLMERGLVPHPPIVNILLGSMGAGPAFVGDLAHIVDRLPSDTEWAAAGIGIYQRPMTIAAAIMDGNVRTGLEDNPIGDEPDWSNEACVALAEQAAALAGRRLATPTEARRRFELQTS